MPARQAAVLGRPIEHSLSPVLHRAAYAALGLDWTYTTIDCGVAELPARLAERVDWAGFSATMPLKHALLDVAAHLRPVARAVGAANTLLPAADGWIADNTDVAGIMAALAEHAVAPRSATVLGAGGTAQATLAALAALGLDSCTMLVREPTRATRALDTAARVGMRVTLQRLDRAASALDADLDADLVVSTLPAGVADPLAARSWRRGQTVLDVVYAGWPSLLADAARNAGATVVGGALLLLHQAAAQVSLMTGQDAPVADMRAALAAALPDCGV